MDILNATRPAARVTRLQGHLQQLLRTTAASWGLEPPSAHPASPRTDLVARCAVANGRHAPPSARA